MIVPMKKAQIVVLKEEKENLLKSLQRYGVLMLTKNEEDSELTDTSFEDSLLQRTEKSLKIMMSYREKKGLFKDYSTIGYDKFISIDPKRHSLLEEIERADEEISRLKSENESIQESIHNLMPWINLDINLSQINKTKYTKIHTGFIEDNYLDTLINIINEFGGELNILGKSSDGQALVFACYIEDNEIIMDRLKSLGFLEIQLPKEDKLISTIINEKQEAINNNLIKIDDLKSLLKELSTEEDELKVLNDQLATFSELKKAPLTHTLNTVYIEGWVRSDRIERLNKAINEATDIYDLELRNPIEGETPPTYTKNNKFASSFETITDMFAKPNSKEVDPNPVMSIWYWIIFGMMMGDAGYGIVMAIMFFGLIKLMKPKGNSLKLFRLLMYSSITTMIWGILFGSYFGITWNPIILEPMAEPLPFLILSLVIGALHVITGILMKAYGNFKNKNYLDIIFDQISWVMIIVGLGFLFIPSLKNIGTALAFTGAIIVFLMAGRSKKNLFARFGSGLYSLYNATGYMSDILSYSRILALSLSGAVIAMVMNMLAGMLQGSIVGFAFSLLVYIIGHLFNIAMSLLSAYVHDSRLQYIEFFNKFYEGGGYEFKPLSIQLKYIDEINDKVEF